MEAKFQLTAGFCLFGALCVLMLPIPWLMGAMTAAVIHEVFHCIAVWLCGGRIRRFTLAAGGAKIETSPLPPGQSVLCALAGPLGSLCTLHFAECLPEAAVCGLIQGIYNLIPIYPLDGGRALRFFLPNAVCAGVEVSFLTVASGLSLALGVHQRDLGVALLLCLWFPVIQRKISCKEGKQAVQ